MIKDKYVLILFFLFQVFFLIAQDTTSIELLPVEITDRKVYTPDKIQLSRSNFLSSAASFDDPSRLLMKYPGFTLSNDQNNAIIYEGMPSHYNTWSMYGAQITSPNHLNNAGTANDRSSRSAGGVNMLSGQVIGGLDFHTGTDGPAHGLGGVADISLRSPFENSYTANLSLIGLEAGLDKVYGQGESSFMGNYRYSTVGLLSQLGVDLGDEIISYQDAIAEYKRKWKGIEVRFTGAYGKSSNDHKASALQGDIDAEFKNIKDIKFGASNKILSVTANSDQYVMTVAYSSRNSSRNSSFILDDKSELMLSNTDESIISFYANRSWERNNFIFNLTLNANRFDQNIVDLNSRDYNPTLEAYERKLLFKENYFELRPKVSVHWDVTKNQKIKLGSSVFVNTLNNEQLLLPFISYKTKIKSFNTLVSWQNDRQSIAPEILGMQGIDLGGNFNNRNLRSMNSWVLKVDVNKNNNGVTFFSNFIYDTPQSVIISPIIKREIFGIDEIGNLPIGKYRASNDVATFGIKAYTKFDVLGYTINANYTMMDSQMDAKSQAKIPLDINSLLNIGVDKSFRFSDYKSLRVSSSFHFRSGFQNQIIDEEESRKKLRTIYSELGYGTLNNYQRLDLRISYIKKGKWKNVISLDIQNVLNRQNDAYNYFDPLLDEVQLQKQLGLIPILSWRIII